MSSAETHGEGRSFRAPDDKHTNDNERGRFSQRERSTESHIEGGTLALRQRKRGARRSEQNGRRDGARRRHTNTVFQTADGASPTTDTNAVTATLARAVVAGE